MAINLDMTGYFSHCIYRVMHVSHDLWKKINAHLHSHKPMLDQDTKDASVVATFPRHWMLPSFPGLMENADILDLYRDADKELIRYKEDEDGLELSLDTHLYQPDQLHITVEQLLQPGQLPPRELLAVECLEHLYSFLQLNRNSNWGDSTVGKRPGALLQDSDEVVNAHVGASI